MTKTTYTCEDTELHNDVELIVNKIVSLTSRADAIRFELSIDGYDGELTIDGASNDTVLYVADLIHNVLVYMVNNVRTTGRDGDDEPDREPTKADEEGWDAREEWHRS